MEKETDKIDKLFVKVELMSQTLNNVENIVSKLTKSDITNRIDIAVIKTKSTIWGSIWGAISGGLMTLIIGILLFYSTKGK